MTRTRLHPRIVRSPLPRCSSRHPPAPSRSACRGEAGLHGERQRVPEGPDSRAGERQDVFRLLRDVQGTVGARERERCGRPSIPCRSKPVDKATAVIGAGASQGASARSSGRISSLRSTSTPPSFQRNVRASGQISAVSGHGRAPGGRAGSAAPELRLVSRPRRHRAVAAPAREQLLALLGCDQRVEPDALRRSWCRSSGSGRARPGAGRRGTSAPSPRAPARAPCCRRR